MGDQSKELFPVPIQFVNGEQPPASKLNAFANQVSAALDFVEKALGDMKSHSHPLFDSSNTPVSTWGYTKSGTPLGSEQRHLQILNLARLIGPASALNPRILSDVTKSIVGETVPNKNEFYLNFPPDGTLSATNPAFSNATKFANFKTNPVDVTNTGDYYVNSAGKVLVADANGSMGTVNYTVTTTPDNLFDSYHQATHNVIPDPNQTTKCTVAVSGSRFRITLPTITSQQANWDETSVTLDAIDDLNHGAQLLLPGFISSEYAAGDQIADNLVALWDKDESRFIDDGVFYFVSTTQIDISTATSLEIGSDRYSLVTHGTDITRLLDQLRTRHRQHSHDGTNGDQRIDHGDLDGLGMGWVNGTASDYYGFMDHGDGDFPNDHAQYLGRWGRDATVSQNAMLGDILLASDHAGAVPPLFDLGKNSFAIVFGVHGTGPKVNYSTGLDGLYIQRKDLILESTFNYKFSAAKTASVVINGASFNNSEALGVIITERPSNNIVTESTTPGTVLYADLNCYVPEGATITSIDVDFEITGAATRTMQADIYSATFGSSPSLVSTASGTGYTVSRQTANFNGADVTLDKNKMNVVALTPGWTEPGSAYIYSVRVNFTHITISRGG